MEQAAVCVWLILLASGRVQGFREAFHSCSVSGILRTPRTANAKRVQKVFGSTKGLVLFWTVCGVLGELSKIIALEGFFFVCLIYLELFRLPEYGVPSVGQVATYNKYYNNLI